MSEFGSLLRTCRKSRGLSQLDLSLEAEVSSKHMSFIETGKSIPSRAMVLQIASALQLPMRERNSLLHAAGYRNEYVETDLADPSMKAVNQALDLLLNSTMPFPALVYDAQWNIIRSNAAQASFSVMLAEELVEAPDTSNLLVAIFHPNGLRNIIQNWEEFGPAILQRYYGETILLGETDRSLLDEVLSYPGVPKSWLRFPLRSDISPILNLHIKLAGNHLVLFSTISTFGSAIDIKLQELRIENFFPANQATRDFFESQAN